MSVHFLSGYGIECLHYFLKTDKNEKKCDKSTKSKFGAKLCNLLGKDWPYKTVVGYFFLYK